MVGWLFDLIGPIATKELIEIARRRRTYWLRAGYGLALLGCLWIAWNNYGGGYGIRALARLGEGIFWLIAAWQVLAVWLIVPILVAPTIVEERIRGSLDLLLTTSLSDREIIVGKLASRLGVLFLLVLAALPILSLILLFGGVRAVDIWRLSIITLLEMVLVGSVAIFLSASRATLGHALWETFVASLIAGLGVSVVSLPFMAFASVFASMPFTATPSAWLWEVLSASGIVPYAALVGLVAYRFCINATRNLRREPAAAPSTPALARQAPNHGAESTSSRVETRGPDARRPDAQRIPWTTLVEFRVAPVIVARRGFDWVILTAIGILALVVSGTVLHATWRSLAGLPLVACGIVLSHSFWLAAVNPIFARGGLRDILLAAPLDPRELLAGALRVTWWQLRPVMALVLPIVIAVIVRSDPAALVGLVTATLFVAATFLVGLACAIPNGNVKQSFACMVCFLVVAGIGPLALAPGLDLPRLSLTWGLTAALAIITRSRRVESPNGWKVGAELTFAYLLVMTTLMAPMAYLISLQSNAIIDPHWATSPIYWLATASGAGRAGGSISARLATQAIFCAAQILFVGWVWRWVNQHFDALVGRPTRR